MAVWLTVALTVLSIAPWTDYAWAAEGYEDVAGSSEMSEMKDVGKYGMTPIYGRSVQDGKYDVEMESSSSFFHIDFCELTVKGNRMKAVMTLSNTSYECVYMGKAVDAARAPKRSRLRETVRSATSPSRCCR